MTQELGVYITIFLPAPLVKNQHQIKRFFDAMVFKLRKNAHKPSFERTDVQHCLARIKWETGELEQAIAEGNTVDIVLEAADIGNFALLASVAAIERSGTGVGGLDPEHDNIRSPGFGTEYGEFKDGGEAIYVDPNGKEWPGTILGVNLSMYTADFLGLGWSRGGTYDWDTFRKPKPHPISDARDGALEGLDIRYTSQDPSVRVLDPPSDRPEGVSVAEAPSAAIRLAPEGTDAPPERPDAVIDPAPGWRLESRSVRPRAMEDERGEF